MYILRKQQIDQFLQCETIAIAGASRKEKSFSVEVATHLQSLGYKLILINPNFETEGNKVKSLRELPAGVNNLLILTPKTQTDNVLKDALDKGIHNIWIQQMSDTPIAIKLAQESEKNVVIGRCIFMFSNPTGIHKFHYTLTKFFGGIPK